MVAINLDVAKRAQENETLRQKLDAKGVEVFVQQPSLPPRKALPKRSMVALSALLASGFALLFFVFFRKAWRNA